MDPYPRSSSTAVWDNFIQLEAYDTPTREELELQQWRFRYEAVGESRRLAKAPLPIILPKPQQVQQAVRSLLFKARCPRLRPPQRWCPCSFHRSASTNRTRAASTA